MVFILDLHIKRKGIIAHLSCMLAISNSDFVLMIFFHLNQQILQFSKHCSCIIYNLQKDVYILDVAEKESKSAHITFINQFRT